MTKVLISEEILQDMADSIREKGGTTGGLKPSAFSTAVDDIKLGMLPPTKGFVVDAWNTSGYPTEITIVGLTSLPSNYFYQYSSYKNVFGYALKVNLPEGLTSIGSTCFYRCSNLKTIKLPSTLKTISTQAFYLCSGLEYIELPSSLTTLENAVFSSCSALKTITIPSGITALNQNCFYDCSSLEEIIFLGNITKINSMVFNGCAKLAKMVFKNVTNVVSLSSSIADTLIAKGTGYVYVPDSLVESFKVASGWQTYAAQIKGLSELEVSE